MEYSISLKQTSVFVASKVYKICVDKQAQDSTELLYTRHVERIGGDGDGVLTEGSGSEGLYGGLDNNPSVDVS